MVFDKLHDKPTITLPNFRQEEINMWEELFGLLPAPLYQYYQYQPDYQFGADGIYDSGATAETVTVTETSNGLSDADALLLVKGIDFSMTDGAAGIFAIGAYVWSAIDSMGQSEIPAQQPYDALGNQQGGGGD